MAKLPKWRTNWWSITRMAVGQERSECGYNHATRTTLAVTEMVVKPWL